MPHTCHHKKCQQDAMQAAETLCRLRGLRFTDHRREVLKILWQDHRAWTAAEIMDELGNAQPPITYRALAFLKEQGLIHHIASMNAYIGCPHALKENHTGQLLVCTNCKQVTELSSDSEINALVHSAEAQGFYPTQTHVEMLGLCADCANSKN